MSCVISYGGRRYSFEEFAKLLLDGELETLASSGRIKRSLIKDMPARQIKPVAVNVPLAAPSKNVKRLTIDKDGTQKFNVTVNMENGEVSFTNNGRVLDPVKDIRLINKAHLKSKYVSYEKFEFNGEVYALTEDGRIINITPEGASNGKEVSSEGPVGRAILKRKDEPEIPFEQTGPTIDVTTPSDDIPDFNDTISEFDEDIDDRSREVIDTDGSYELWDEQKETQWFKENYPGVPLTVLADLRSIAGKASPELWGLFRNSAVFISQQAKTGTLYHEAFHVVFHTLLNDVERASIIDAGERFAKGAIGIEEYWADRFMEYQLSQAKEERGLPENVLDLFRRLWHIISILAERTGIKGAASMNDYMYRVSRGLYNKGIVKRFGGVKFKRDVTRFRPVDSTTYLNIREEEYAKRLMNGILINTVLPKYRSLYGMESLSDADLIKEIIKRGKRTRNPALSLNGLYANVHRVIQNSMALKRNESDRKVLERTLNSIGTVNADGTLTMRKLSVKAARYLKYYGINMTYDMSDASKTSDAIDEVGIMEEDEEQVESWAVKDKFLSGREKFSQKAKAMFSMIPLKGVKFGGMTVFENPSNVYNTIASKISGSPNVDTMLSRLDELVKLNPGYKVITTAMTQDPHVITEFWVNVAQRTFTPFFIVSNEKGRSKIFYANHRDMTRDMRKQWLQSFYDSKFYDPSTEKVSGDLSERISEFERLRDDYKRNINRDPLEKEGPISREDAQKVYNLMKLLNLPLTKREINMMFSIPDDQDAIPGGKRRFVESFAPNIIYYMKRIQTGNNPFVSTIDNDKALNSILKVYQEVFPQAYQHSFRSGAGEMIYSLLQSRFMQNLRGNISTVDNATRMATIDSYMEDPFYSTSPFFRMMMDRDVAMSMELGVMDSLKSEKRRKGTEYSELTGQELEAFRINAYFNIADDATSPSSNGIFLMPILSDSTSAALIKIKKMDIDESRQAIIDSALQEWNRIKWLRSRIQPVKQEYNTWLKDQKDSKKSYSEKARIPEQLNDIPVNMLLNGLYFQVFRSLNENIKDLKDDQQVIDAVGAEIPKIIESELKSLYTEKILAEENGTIFDNTGLIDSRFMDPESFDRNISSYLYNSLAMNLQTLFTFGGDPAFYKSRDSRVDYTDVFKRIKEIWSPGDYMNAHQSNMFTSRDGNIVRIAPEYGVLYVNDPADISDVVSDGIRNIERIHRDNPDRESIVKAFSELNETDAATIIDPIRAMQLELGFNGLNEEKYEFYTGLVNGDPMRHIGSRHIHQPIKPFQFLHSRTIDPVTGHVRINPVQHKNSETLITPAMAVGSPKLEAIMSKFGYVFKADGTWTYDPSKRITDSVMFTSAVKVGKFKAVDSIEAAVKEDVHRFKNADYRRQQLTPEHHLDTNILEGTQYRKLVVENVDPLHTYMLNGVPTEGAEILRRYNEALYRNVQESYDELKKLFTDADGNPDNTKIVEALRQQAIENEKPDDLLTALDWATAHQGYYVEKDGELVRSENTTVLPLWHPSIAYDVETMMNSFFKNRVTKQKTNKGAGASLYNATSYGFEKGSKKGYRKPEIKWSEDGNSIEYFEAILPVTLSSLERYADKNGIIDISKIEGVDPDILKAVFYRIPTEHKYSMFHIKVIGFLPQGVGGQIILPEEATKIAGLDFDIDKLYGILYNIEEYSSEVEGAEERFQSYISTMQWSSKLKRDIVRKEIPDFDELRSRREFANKEGIAFDEDTGTFRKYSLRKVPSGMETKASRDNLKLDIAFSVLSDARTAKEITTPGGFETLKALVKEISSKKTEKDSMGTDTLNPLLNSTSREVFERNMTGNGLIGIFANHVSNQALVMQGNVTLKYPLKFNGMEKISLSGKDEGTTFDDLVKLKEFLAAAVDNGKDPVASFLNITMVTADMIATLVRMGFGLEASVLFFNTPQVIRATKGARSADRLDLSGMDDITDEYIRRRGRAAYDEMVNYLSTKALKFDPTTRTGSIMDLVKMGDRDVSAMTDQELVNSLAVYRLLKRVAEVSTGVVAPMTRAMRYDSIKNAAGPTVAHTLSKLDDVDTILKAQEAGIVYGVGELLSMVESNPIRWSAAFRERGLEASLADIYNSTGIPYTDRYGESIYHTVKNAMKASLPLGQRIQPETVNLMHYAISSVLASSFGPFRASEFQRVINDTPTAITTFMNENPESPYIPLLKYLNVIPSENVSGMKVIRMNRTGIDATQMQSIKMEFLSMLRDADPKVSSLANDIAAYSIFATGFVTSPSKLSDILPTMYWAELKDDNGIYFTQYMENQFNRNMFDDERSENISKEMSSQIIRNMYRSLPFIKYFDTSNADSIFMVNDGVTYVKVPPNKVNNTEKQPLEFIRTVLKTKGQMRSALMVFHSIEGDDAIYREVPLLGSNNEFLEFNYDNAMSDTMTYTQIVSTRKPSATPTRMKDRAVKPVDAAEAVLTISDILPGFDIDSIAPLEGAMISHPLFKSIQRLSPEQLQQLRERIGSGKNVMSMFEKIKELKESKVPVTTKEITVKADIQPLSSDIVFEEEQTTGYKNRTIKNASADATIAIAVDFNSAGEKLTKSSVLNQGKKYIPIDANNLTVTEERVNKIVEQLNSIKSELKVTSNQAMSYKMSAKDNLTGENTSTLELVEKGLRTATTRSFPLGKVGDIITFENKPQKYRITEIEQLTEEKVENPEWVKKWSNKEQWTIEHFKQVLGGKTVHIGSYQTSFEKVEDAPKEISLNIAGNGIYTMKGKYTQQQVDNFTYELLNRVINSPNLKTKIESIRTGGQTGFDEAGTKAGIKLGLSTLTLAPKGWTFRNIEGKDISNEQEFKARFSKVLSESVDSVKDIDMMIMEENNITQEEFNALPDKIKEMMRNQKRTCQ